MRTDKDTKTSGILTIGIVLMVGCALLSISSQRPATVNQNQVNVGAFVPMEVSSAVRQPRIAVAAAACNGVGRPCGFHGYPCCAGLKCVDVGGSTRAGYQCRPVGTAIASTVSLKDDLSADKIERDGLTEVLR
jgi:hypothetical protein